MREAALAAPAEAAAVIDFWREAGLTRWFAKDAEFDRAFRDRFLTAYETARRGELFKWTASPEKTLALLILLDQFPRNAFRGTRRMYDTDPLALGVARAAVDAGHDLKGPPDLQLFSISLSAILKSSPIRSDPSSSPDAWESRACPTQSATTTSFTASGDSRTATSFLGG